LAILKGLPKSLAGHSHYWWYGRPLAKLNALSKVEALFAPIATIISWKIGNPTESMLRISNFGNPDRFAKELHQP